MSFQRDSIVKSMNDLGGETLRAMYDDFDSPVTSLDCGRRCSSFNPGGKPFCCDICHAVPVAYHSEWGYFQAETDLWSKYRGDECGADPSDSAALRRETPQNMLLLACLGPDRCQRRYRSLSCRQFPFFPYVTSDARFIGLTGEWAFEEGCWVLSNLARVSKKYRQSFIRTFDRVFALDQEEFDSYARHSGRLRRYCRSHRRRFVLLHRNGGIYKVSPRSERLTLIDLEHLPKFGLYRG